MSRYAPERDAFRELTRRPFIVVDTETTLAAGSKIQRLVSYALVPVIGGQVRRDLKTLEFVHPGVPIHPKSTNIHNLTDYDVEGLPGFDAHVLDLLAAFQRPGVIFVAHNAPFDVTVLRNEFALLGLTMPDMPVIDTMTLPKATGFTATSLTTKPSLTLLAGVLGVKVKAHHTADDDARTAADILIQLLNRAAASGTATEIDALLVAHGSLRVSTIKDTGQTRSRNGAHDYVMPPDHLAEHAWVLPSPQQMRVAPVVGLWDRWWDHVAGCATALCPLLEDDLQTVRGHDPAMAFSPLTANLSQYALPGQLATLIGAMMRALSPAMTPRQELAWWKAVRPAVLTGARCTDTDACPDCRKGLPCPLDVAHEYAAESLLCEPTGEFRPAERLELSLQDWGLSAPEVGGHVAWRLTERWLAERDPVKVGQIVGASETLGLHRVDPHLAIRVATQLMGRGQDAEAVAVLASVQDPASTNPAQTGVDAALARIAAQQRKAHPDPEPGKHAYTAAMRRPDGRTRPNQFRPWA